ncbi:MAG: ParB N-terminal domain-containing protein [Actinomycetota bacterium]
MSPARGDPDRSTFERAMRKRTRQRMSHTLRNEDTAELLPLGEVSRRLRQFAQRYVGIRTIPIDRIVGTVDRAGDFDRQFLPRRPQIRDRWKRVEAAFPEGNFPPIVVYEVEGSYFLVDGHHRVAIAKQRGMAAIDAEVTELKTRYPLPPDADIGRIIHTEQERTFLEDSGLERGRPDARVELTRPHGYLELLDDVRVHGYFLMKERREPVPDEEIAADWHDWVYGPVVEAAQRAGLREVFPAATDGDLYLWLQDRRRALYPQHGPLPNEEVARLAREEEERARRRTLRTSPKRPPRSR